MKLIFNKFFFLFILFVAFQNEANSQSWDWNGRSYNEKIQNYIRGTIEKMDTEQDCTSWNYGDKDFQTIEVLSYSLGIKSVSFKFKFSWRIKYGIGGKNFYSYTLAVRALIDGCNSNVTYLSDTGGPSCECGVGEIINLGCIY